MPEPPARSILTPNQMPEYGLITPFPEASLPNVFHWISPYIYKTEHFDKSIDQFVAAMSREREQRQTWAISREGEIGGYVQLDQGRFACVEVLFKPQFFHFFRQTVIVPALSEIVSEAFKSGASLVVFEPLESNRALIGFLRKFGAREAGSIAANGIPEKRVMSIGSGDWKL